MRLLQHLLARGDAVVDRGEILSAVWGYHPQSESQAVHVAVRRLRRKIEVDPEAPDHLVTVAGRGWRLIPAPGDDDGLVGRGAELARLRRALAEPGLVVVVGPGGVGKTALARVAARGDPRPTFRVEAAEVRDEGGLEAAVRSALGDRGASDPGDALARREVALLVLDNLEQVAGPAASLVGRWIARAPSLTVLGTSRTALGIEGERTIELAPLSPADGLRLLQLRARSAGARWTDDDPALPVVVDLVDALPLALELAAGRAALFAPSELAERLGRGLDALGGGAGRHRTLRETVDWSWSLLDEGQQRALAELAVFRGGFDARSAEAALTGPRALDHLAALVGHGLVRRDSDRLDLYAAVRERAAEALPASSPAHERHARWFAAMGAQDRIDALDGPDGARLRPAARREVHNLAAAARWALSAGLPGVAAPAARILAVLAAGRAVPDALPVLREVLGADGLDPVDRALLEVNLGVLLHHALRPDEALEVLARAEARTDDPRVAGLVALARTNVHLRASAYAEAEAAGRRGLERARGMPALCAMLTANLAAVEVERGDRAAALPLYEEAEAAFRRAGEARWATITAGNRAIVLAGDGRLEEAHVLLDEVVATLSAQAPDDRSAGLFRVTRAHVLLDRGRRDEARVELMAGLEQVRRSGDETQLSMPLALLGQLHLEAGELDAARDRTNEALALSRRAGDRNAVARRLAQLARIALASGDPARSRQLLGEAERWAGPAPVPSVVSELHLAREALGDRSVG